MTLRTARLTAILLAAALAVACTQGGGSIYFTLENEVKVDDNSLPNEMTVFDLASVGGAYYVAAGKIWTASTAAVNFDGATVVDPPGGPAAVQLCTALAAFGGELYGGFVDESGNLGLYKTAALAFGAAAVPDAGVAGAQVRLLKVENGQLAVVTARASGADFTYTVVTTPGYAELGGLAARAAADKLVPINDVIYSTSLGAWFVTEGETLYTDIATPGTLQASAMAGTPTGDVLTGLFDDATTVYIASEGGAVYWWDASGTPSWKKIEAPTVSGAHPPLTRFAGPVGAGILLVGSDGYGYYRLDTTDLGGTAPLSRFPTTTIDLYTASVRQVVLDGTTAFALTSGAGLWRGTVAGDGSITWGLE